MRIPKPTKRVVAPVCAILGILAAWQGACSAGLVPNFMLPSPVQVVAALVGDLPLLCQHLLWTLAEAALGLAIGVAVGFAFAVLMDRFETFYLDGQPLRPTANHVHKSFVLLKLPGVDDMNTALSYKGKTLSIRRADAPLREGEYFDQDLLGLQVYDCETGELLGELQAVDPYPASKVYTVRGKKEYLIPAIPEVFIRSVDLDQNRMEVHILEGMATDEI